MKGKRGDVMIKRMSVILFAFVYASVAVAGRMIRTWNRMG